MRDKNKFLILFCLIFFIKLEVNAYLPILPLSYRLETTNKHITEGDKIEFILTIKNIHLTKTFPILTPGSQNSGKKLVYLRVYDPASNFFVLRAMESRDIYMPIDDRGSLGMVWLKPGEEFSITFFWNDSENYLTRIASHHSFEEPLFAGRYEFQAFYDPSQTGIGDTLYHFMRTTNDRPSDTKLTFFGPGISPPCAVTIAKREPGCFKIDGLTYISPNALSEGAFSYYLNSVVDSNLVAAINTILPDGTTRVQVRLKRYNNTEWLQHFESGNILKYARFDGKKCPTEYYSREFYNDSTLRVQTDSEQDGSIIRIIYYEDGRMKFKELYSMSTLIHTTTEFIYKDTILLNKIRKTEKFKVPCEIVLDELLKKTNRIFPIEK